ncbi:hypothetical protein DIPPA_30303 [Diplonema papillatum]|nr:hypothetical protein DIPPA_30303 [Diplonema papillatum]
MKRATQADEDAEPRESYGVAKRKREAALPRRTPKVFVPSKGRCWKVRGTIRLLAQERIPAVCVVEPQEEGEYRDWLADSCIELHVLKKNDGGVSYARNTILHKLAPKDDWYWILDDDVSAFAESTEAGVTEITARSALESVLNLPEVSDDPSVAVFSLEYRTFSVGFKRYLPGHFAFDGYCNVCVAYHPARLPEGIQFNFRQHEDYDFALTVIKAGKKTARARWISFEAPQMGKARGGMFDFYTAGNRACLAETTVFVHKWQHVCQKMVKTVDRRVDVRVKWAQLAKLMPLQIKHDEELEKKLKARNENGTQ